MWAFALSTARNESSSADSRPFIVRLSSLPNRLRTSSPTRPTLGDKPARGPESLPNCAVTGARGFQRNSARRPPALPGTKALGRPPRETSSYWDFFPAEDGWAQMPVWGFADVVASEADGVPEGTRVYGYLPPGSHLVVQPDRPSQTDFVDASPHRADLPAAYNRYSRTE